MPAPAPPLFKAPAFAAAAATALSLLFAGAARADEADALQSYRCIAQDGQSVAIVRGALPPGNTGAYSDFYGNRQPMIVYDPRWMAGADEATRRLAIAHECRHHRLGHLAKSFKAFMEGHPPSFDEQLQMEFDADCGALQEGRDTYGYGRAEARAFFAYIEKTTPERVAPLIKRREEHAFRQCPALR